MSAHSPQPSLWQAGRALVRRDLQLLWRRRSDALQPALEALQKGNIQAAAQAAQQGAEATSKMAKAGAGRSSYVNKENLDGVMDPGAVAVAEVFNVLAQQ